MSEDCLYLNIWTSAKTENNQLPVLIWIHGGDFTGGYGHEPEFDGKAFNKNGVILVTINYRLGTLGFLSHPWLQADGEFCSSTKTEGLFAKAIFQSATGTHSICLEISQQEQAKQMAEIIEALGYQSLEELKAAPYKVLIHDINVYIQEHQLNGMQLLSPNIDGHLLTKSCDDILIKETYHDIPYMIASAKNELFSPETAIAIANSSYGFASLQSTQHQQPVCVYYSEKHLPGDNAGAFPSGELWYEFGILKRC